MNKLFFLLFFTLSWLLIIFLNIHFNHKQITTLELIEKKHRQIDILISEFVTYLSIMKDAETGERGFIITGDEIFLEPYNNALSYLNDSTTNQLFNQTKQDFSPAIQAQLAQLQNLQQLILTDLQQVIDVRKKEGFEAAKNIVLNRAGKNWMDQIRKLIAQVINELQKSRIKIDQDFKNNFDKLIFYNTFGSIAYLLFSFAFFLKLYQEMKTAKKYGQELFRLDVQKDEFISMVSHEMRTPLASIAGALDLILTRNLNQDEHHELLLNAQRNSDRLINLVNDIIDVQKVHLGKFDLFNKKVQINTLVSEVIAISAKVADKKNIKIVIEENHPNIHVYADPIRLQQVVTSFLSNAIKFSPEGTIINVMIELLNDWVRFSVQDQGAGIHEEFQSKIFNIFSQQDASTKRSAEGAGLELFIAKNIIEKHGGKIGFSTYINKGSTFYFELPLFKE